MIFPFLKGFFSFDRVPLTYVIAILNLVIFVSSSGVPNNHQFYMDKALGDGGIEIIGRLYEQYQNRLSVSDPVYLKMKAIEDPERFHQMLGVVAVRNNDFISSLQTQKFYGNQIEIENILRRMKVFAEEFHQSPIYKMGLLSFEGPIFNWITYQFTHSTYTHLFSNMIFFLIFAMAIESIFGSAALAFLYLVGGVLGGIAFILFSNKTGVPVVGASSSISCLMTFFMVTHWRRNLRFIYFLSPLKEHNGYIYLPGMFLLPLYFLSDLVQFLTEPFNLSWGIAHSAHVGGGICGILFGLVYMNLFRTRSKSPA